MSVLDELARLAARAAYRVVQEYRDLDDRMEVAKVGLMDDGTLGPDDPYNDVYATRIGFSTEQGRLKREE